MFFREAGRSRPATPPTWRCIRCRFTLDLAGIGVVLLLVLPLLASPYELTVCNLILVAVVGAIGLNILTGYCGQISIGQGGFMAAGAYTAAKHGDVQAHLLACHSGRRRRDGAGRRHGRRTVVRIKGLYLAIATLAAQFIIEWLINHVTWISGGIQATIQMPTLRCSAWPSTASSRSTLPAACFA